MILQLLLNTQNDMGNIYENIEEYSINKELKTLIVFDDKIANILSNKKLNLIAAELLI